MPILYGLMGLGIGGMAFRNTISDIFFWLGMELSLLMLFIAWRHFRAGKEFERALDRLNECEDILSALGYERGILGWKKREDENMDTKTNTV